MTWNGYGLSFWRCRCGAARRVESVRVNEWEGLIVQVNATPCKRCGDEGEPVGWPSDPWLGLGAASAATDATHEKGRYGE